MSSAPGGAVSVTLRMKAPGSTSTPKRCPLPSLAHLLLELLDFFKTDGDPVYPLSPDIFCEGQNLHQVVDLTYTIWGANEPNGREYENCIETRLKSFSNGTQKYPKQIQKHPVYIQSKYLRYVFFHFGKGMRVGTTPPARRVEGDFSASFQKSRFFISEASPIARCYFIFLLENEIIFSNGIFGFWLKDLSTILKQNLFAA